MQIITNNEQLKDLCDHIIHQEFIVIDTEFVRQLNYFPTLCLMQIADNENAWIIDCLSFDVDFNLLKPVLIDAKILKILHSCRQDVEIILHKLDIIPNPIYDTQIVAAMSGFGHSVGLEKLANQLLNINIDKTNQFTDWAKRPLSPAQLSYALNDVIYIRSIYKKLSRNCLIRDWVDAELESLQNREIYIANPDNAWRKIKLHNKSDRYIFLAKALAKWREINAQKHNIIRGKLLHDDVLLELAKYPPNNVRELLEVIKSNNYILKFDLLEDLFMIIKSGHNISEKEIRVDANKPCDALLQMLKILVKMSSHKYKISDMLLASNADLLEIAAAVSEEDLYKIPAMQGWRYEAFGNYVEKLKAGEIAFKLVKNQIVVINCESQ